MKTIRSAVVATILSCASLASASAATITFTGLQGENNTPFTSYSMEGFTVAASAGDVRVGTVFGNPVPSLFGVPSAGSPSFAVTLTRLGGGTFTIDGFDLSNNGGGVTTISVVGRRASNIVLSLQAQFGGPSGFATLATGSVVAVETVVLSFTPTGTSANLDNIRVTPVGVAVPEPASAALLVVGLAGLGLTRRMRRSA